MSVRVEGAILPGGEDVYKDLEHLIEEGADASYAIP